MNLIQIGRTFINLDRVTVIRDLSTRDGAGLVTQPFYRVEFDNHESVEIATGASAFQGWLSSHVSAILVNVGAG